MKYVKKTPRLSVKIFNGDTNELVGEITDRNWMNVGELFADHYLNNMIPQYIKKDLPDNIVMLASAEYNLQ